MNPQKAYDSIGADLGVTCGNIELAVAAGMGFSSPVYSFHNTYEPSSPWPYQATGYVAAFLRVAVVALTVGVQICVPLFLP